MLSRRPILVHGLISTRLVCAGDLGHLPESVPKSSNRGKQPPSITIESAPYRHGNLDQQVLEDTIEKRAACQGESRDIEKESKTTRRTRRIP
jgi:hypothetical protein